MKKHQLLKMHLLLILTLFSGMAVNAQLSGVLTVPGSYPTISAAVTDLNAQGVGPGGVIFNIAAGHTETLSAPISLTATGTLSDPIVFQKSGIGNNPVVTAYTGGTGTPSSASQDGIWNLVGADYVTIDGIDLMDNPANLTNPSTMEYGFALYKANVSNGCQFVTIQNCVITLNRVNNASGSGPNVDGSVGINMTNATPSAATTTLTINAASGSHSNNKFYGNTIQNCNIGIALIGYADGSPFTNADNNNDVGGLLPLTGNIIRNYGGGAATSPAAAVRTLQQKNLNVSYNTIINNDGSGVNHTTTLRGIYLNTSTSASANVTHNTITLHGGGTTSLVAAVENASGSTANGNTININDNSIINSTYNTATSGIFYAVYNNGATPSNLNINNNTISNTTLAGTATIPLIETGSPVNATVNNNTITNNTRTGTSGTWYLIKTTTPTTLVVDGNLMDGNHFTAPTSTGTSYGFYSLSSAVNVTVSNNRIGNMNTPTTGSLYGIRENSVAGIKIIENNEIYNLVGAGAATVYGIFTTVGTVTIHKNKIYNLSSGGTGTATYVYGISVSGGTAHTITNNIIGELYAPTANSTNAIMGIHSTSTTTASVLDVAYNSVYINATSSGTNFGTTGLFHTVSGTATTATLNLRNNVIVNTSTPNGTGLTVAYRRSGTNLGNYGSVSNRNLFYAGTPSTNRLIFSDGTNSDQTLSAYKTRVSTRDAQSVTENPPFLSTVGANSNFLHINPVIPTQVESGGANIPGITTDFDNDIRQGNPGYVGTGTAPDLGADEMNGMLLDLTAPVISYLPIANGCGTGDFLVSNITITDASGVPTVGTLRPRIYYKKGVGGAWFSQPGTLASGSATNGSWNFTVVAADMGGLILGDQVYYYVIAQDVAVAPNLSANPGAGLVATDVNTVATPPNTPNSYIVIDILSGTYTVGAGGNYPTLTAAVADYNSKCVNGPLVFDLIDATYSGSETFPIIINQNAGASPVNTLTIKPASNNTATITGSLASNALIRILGNYVTIDGSNNSSSSRNLTISNTSTTAPNVVLIGAPSTVPVTNVTLKNTRILNGTQSSTTAYAVVVSSSASIGGAGYFNNISILHNDVQKSYIGIYANATVVAGNGNGLLVDTNDIIATGADAVRFTGVYVQGVDGATVRRNHIANFDPVTAEVDRGVWIATSTRNSLIEKNLIHDMKYTGTSGYSAYGIAVSTGLSAANVTVSNNMIYGISGDADSYVTYGATYSPVGVYVFGTGQAGVNIYYNTIFLSGNTVNYAGSYSIGIALDDGSAATIKNNIINNNLGLLSSTGVGAVAIAAEISTAQFTAIDYNNYFCAISGSGSNFIGKVATTDYASLSAFQAATGQDAHSVNIQPNFVSPTDLHLDPLTNVPLDNLGTPIPGITTDIDGNTRSLTTPDMGADEFVSPACAGASGGTISPNSYNLCDGQDVVLTSVGADGGIGISYQWKSSLNQGGPYVNVTGGTGATTTSYTTAPLLVGTYYYVLETHCSFGSLTGLSNEVTVTVNPIPSSAASSNSPVCEGVPLNLTGTTDVGVTFSWTGPNGYSSSLQNPTIVNPLVADGGAYSFIASANGCSSAVATVVAVVTPGVINPMATATPAVLCLGDTLNLSAQADPFADVILREDFNAGAPNWSRVNNSTGGTPANAAWLDIQDGYVYGLTPQTFRSNDSTQFVMTNSDAQGSGSVTNASLITPAFSTVGLTNINIDFFHYYRDINDSGDSALVEVSTDGLTWTQATFYGSTQGGSSNFVPATVILAPAFENQPTVYVRFRFKATWDWYWAIDNVTITGLNSTFTYSWSSVPSGFTSTQQNPSGLTPNTSTVYDVVINNSYGCSATASVNVTVNPLPLVNLGNDTVYCQGSPFSATYNAGNPGSQYSWNTGATTQTETVTGQGIYSVMVTDINGCSGYDTVEVMENPVPLVNLGNDTAYCQGSPFNAVYNAGNPGSQYNWSTGATSQTETITGQGTYSVTVTDGNGCVGSDTVVVTQNPLPVVNLGPDIITANPPVTLDAGNPGSTYLWSTNATTQTINVTTNGTYIVVVTNSFGCTSSDTIHVTFTMSTINLDGSNLELSLYPNPATDRVNLDIRYLKADRLVIELMDVAGKVITSNVLENPAETFVYPMDVQSLSAGPYLIRISSETGSHTLRMIKH